MGMDSIAKVFYGILIPEETSWGEDEHGNEEDFEIAYAAVMGCCRPKTKWDDAEEEWRQYWDRCKALLETARVDVDYHGNDYWTGRFLYRIGAFHDAWNGQVTEVDFTVPDGADEDLKHVCEAVGIPWTQPRWLLVSSYG